MKLIAKNISKTYRRSNNSKELITVLQEQDFELKQNSLTGIFGRSGSGKSTFLNIVSGLLRPTTGEVLIRSEDSADTERNIYSLKDKELCKLRNDYFGIIPQGQNFISSLSVIENIMLPIVVKKSLKQYVDFSDIEYRERAAELMNKTGIFDLQNAYPKDLSGGELRRMAIARALINKPAFIFADEPTSNLDDENVTIVLELLKRIANEGTSVLLVTHEQEAKNYVDIALYMKNGLLGKY